MTANRGTIFAGLIAAAAVGASLGLLCNAIYRGGADAGDWLQFFGGAIGAALTVAGSVYLSSRHERAERNREREILIALTRRLEIYLICCLLTEQKLDEVWPGEGMDRHRFGFQQISTSADLFERFEVGRGLRDTETIMGLNRLMRVLAEYALVFRAAEQMGVSVMHLAEGKELRIPACSEEILLAVRQLLMAVSVKPTPRNGFEARLREFKSEDEARRTAIASAFDD